ncbi:GTPase domain-containing protein [Legionella impletisoli]|uniref:Rho GTPase (Miro-like) n=1 Tax=Legionella impletisoli TaxID=343510 RepID=A0A917K0E2_9GAMM|nr:ADP-ribosylation factor-like protein [Legionella impletisoli]GGI93316.1 hypothetical protein GCM10007966_22350 [Legionella impletisoli]
MTSSASITLFLGKQDSGKTSLIKRAWKNLFSKDKSSDDEAVYYVVRRGDIGLKIWDLRDDRLSELIKPRHYEKAALVVYCVDLSKPFDKEAIEQELRLIREKNSKVEVLLVGTKSDLANPQTSSEQLSQFAAENRCRKPIITSAQADDHVDTLFAEIKNIVENADKNSLLDKPETSIFYPMSSILKNVPKGSILYNPLLKLNEAIKPLKVQQQKPIIDASKQLIDTLQSIQYTLEEKQEAIIKFHQDCHESIKDASAPTNRSIMKKVAVVVISAFLSLTIALIGIATHLWAGPGSLVAGALAFGVSAGASSAFLNKFRFFNPKTPLENALESFLDAANQNLTRQTSDK